MRTRTLVTSHFNKYLSTSKESDQAFLPIPSTSNQIPFKSTVPLTLLNISSEQSISTCSEFKKIIQNISPEVKISSKDQRKKKKKINDYRKARSSHQAFTKNN